MDSPDNVMASPASDRLLAPQTAVANNYAPQTGIHLYHMPFSSCSQMVRLALHTKKASFEPHVVDIAVKLQQYVSSTRSHTVANGLPVITAVAVSQQASALTVTSCKDHISRAGRTGKTCHIRAPCLPSGQRTAHGLAVLCRSPITFVSTLVVSSLLWLWMAKYETP